MKLLRVLIVEILCMFVNKSWQEINDYFGWLIDAIKEKGKDAERVLVYWQTVKQCASLYQLFADNRAKCMYSDKSFNSQKRLVEMLHSKTPESVKNTVLDSFRRENGLIRILLATVAVGMGATYVAGMENKVMLLSYLMLNYALM